MMWCDSNDLMVEMMQDTVWAVEIDTCLAIEVDTPIPTAQDKRLLLIVCGAEALFILRV